MKYVLLHLSFFMSLMLSAQQSALSGVVSVFNSQFETGKKQYINNASVEESYGKSQASTTNTEGVFKLPLVGIADGGSVFLFGQKRQI